MLRIKDACQVSIGMKDADFWIVRKGSAKNVGSPVREYDKEKIGVKVIRRDIIDPRYLFYAMTFVHQLGVYQPKGSLELKHITVDEVKNIVLQEA
jgi:choline kinase